MTVVVAGYFCLDIAPNLDHLPAGQFRALFQPGRLLQVGEAKFTGGGAVSNTGLVLHRLGISTSLIAKVGGDPFGRALCEIVARQDPGLLEDIQIEESGSTSYTLIFDPPGVDRTFINFPGTNDSFGIHDIDFDVIAKARLFHFGYPPGMRQFYLHEGEQLVSLYRQAQAAGTTTSLDTSFPDLSREGGQVDWKRLFRRSLPFVDIFLPSIEELLFTLRPETHRELLEVPGGIITAITPELLAGLSDELLELGVKVALIKLGHRGAYLRTGSESALNQMGSAAPQDLSNWHDRELWAPSFRAQVVGTTGAGDAAIAGFLSALLRGCSAEQALTMAVAVGSCSVEEVDSLSGVPAWDEILDRIDQGWPRHPLDLVESGWQKDKEFNLWNRP